MLNYFFERPVLKPGRKDSLVRLARLRYTGSRVAETETMWLLTGLRVRPEVFREDPQETRLFSAVS